MLAKTYFKGLVKIERKILKPIIKASYSGYCIKYQGDYTFLLEQLNSQRLADFIAVSSRDFRGGWKAYNKKALEEFTITKPQDKKVSAEKTTNSPNVALAKVGGMCLFEH
ncbi:MAG: hypothetical protein OHK0045_15410 [Raineya sp.]